MRNFIKVSYLLVLAGLLFSFSYTSKAQGFEGRIKFKISSDGNETFINYYIKNNKFRIDVPGGMGGAMIVDKKKMIMIMPEQKMYMEFEMDKIREKVGEMMKKADKNKDENDDNFNPADVEKYKTGKTKEMFGHKCEQVIYNDEESGETIEAWVATDMGSFMFAQNPMMPDEQPEWQKTFGEGYFPMQVIVKDKDGNTKDVFEVAELKEESLSPSLFEIPEGFQKMSIPGMN